MSMDLVGGSQPPEADVLGRGPQDADSLYQEGLQHFQNGRWQEAIEGFEAVLRLAPEHLEARAFLEEARLKASLDQDQPKPKRTFLSGRMKRLILVAGAMAAVLVVLVAAKWAYERFIVPGQAQQQAQARLARQLEQANKLLGERDYAAAEQAFRTLLELDPASTAAQQGLADAQKKSALSADYAKAQQELEKENWDEAARLLTAIIAQDSGFKDAQALLTKAQGQQQLTSAFEAAESGYASGDWKKAFSAYESLRNLDAEYRRETVTEHLFKSYVKLGVQLVAGAGTSTEPVQEAQILYQKALELKPQDAEAVLELLLAEKYLDGEGRLAQGDKAGAAVLLEWVVQQKPNYAGGNAAALLATTGAVAKAAEVTPTPAAVVVGPTPAPPAVAEGIFQQKYASLMSQGDAALKAADYAAAEQDYHEAALAAVHGGYNSARWLFAAYAKAGTASARRGDYAPGVEQVRTAITIITKSATAIPVETYTEFVSNGDNYATKKDYPSALSQYSKALQVISQKCNCGLENWSILP